MGHSPFDDMVVASLNELDEGFFEQMLEVFMGDLARSQDAIRVALDGRDLPRLEEQAHRLRSAAANLGAARLEDICSAIERCSRDGDVDGVEEQVWTFYAEVGRIFTWANRREAA